MNIIFLDIDGVLLAYQPSLFFNQMQYGYDHHVLDTFLTLLENSPEPSKIVLISTKVKSPEPWRWLTDAGFMDRFKKLLHPEMPCLKTQYVSGDRYQGILEWLQEYGTYVNKSIIIDDSIDVYTRENNPLLPSYTYLIPCCCTYGMHWVELRLLKELLKISLTKSDKLFIRDYLQHGMLFHRCSKLQKFWDTNISHLYSDL